MDVADNGFIQQLDEFLSRPNQSWLLGAGISKDAGIPLMYPLTARVMDLAMGSAYKPLLDALIGEISAGSHVEHLLSHLGDYTTLGKRNSTGKVTVGGIEYHVQSLEAAHVEVLGYIAETARWGYKAAHNGLPETVGSYQNPIVSVNAHLNFVQALIGRRQAGLEGRRRPVRLFTTNYDTLIEDALALSCYSCWDGFSGGGLAFRNHRYGDTEPETGYRAHLIKLHGSIDWYLGEEGKVWRVRDRDLYPVRTGRVLIYPQSTKYVATQRDPFSAQFDIFRRALAQPTESVLGICGYSFGDEHINQEIELSLEAPENKTTLLAFCGEFDKMPTVLETWRHTSWGNRVYIMTQRGLYVGSEGPFHGRSDGTDLDWWTFSGLTKVLLHGSEGAV